MMPEALRESQSDRIGFAVRRRRDHGGDASSRGCQGSLYQILRRVRQTRIREAGQKRSGFICQVRALGAYPQMRFEGRVDRGGRLNPVQDFFQTAMLITHDLSPFSALVQPLGVAIADPSLLRVTGSP